VVLGNVLIKHVKQHLFQVR